MSTAPSEKLSSWKEIAAFLGVDEKTARRYEKERGMPVRSVPAGRKRTVYADPGELQAWLDGNSGKASGPPVPVAPQVPETPLLQPAAKAIHINRKWPALLLGVLIVFAAYFHRGTPPIRLAPDPAAIDLSTRAQPPLMTARGVIYFQKTEHNRLSLWRIGAGRRNPELLDLNLENPDPGVVAADGSAMLLRDVHGFGDQPLYIQPLPSGKPRRVGNILDYDAAWTPDQRSIMFGALRSVYRTDVNGQGTRLLFDVPGHAYHFRWSPAGVLRFSVYDSQKTGYTIWEQTGSGQPPRPVSLGLDPGVVRCCGEWSADGKTYFFQAVSHGFWQIFAHDERSGLWGSRDSETVQLTSGLTHSTSPLPFGDRLLVLSKAEKSEVLQFDSANSRWSPLLDGVDADAAAFSPDGHWLLYTRTPDHTLWRCGMPGCRSPVQLTFEPLRVTMPRLSPDGSRVAFMARETGRAWQVMMLPSRGGTAVRLFAESGAQADPSWSPDGKQIAAGFLTNPDPSVQHPIQIIDLASGAVHDLPGSHGMNDPVWAPNGRLLAAVQLPSRELAIFDFASGKWKTVHGACGGYLNWSSDSKRLYFRELKLETGETENINRLDLNTFQVSRAAATEKALRPAGLFGGWVGLGPGESPLALRDLSTGQLLSWRFQQR